MPSDITIRAGELRHRVTFYELAVTKNADTGAETTAYTSEFATVSASMNPASGKKYFAGGRFQNEQINTCMIRYREGIDETMQLEFRERRFEILTVDDVEERKVKMMLALRELT